MSYVLVEEASCESALLDASRSYRFVLSSSGNPGFVKSDLKSVYIPGKPVVRSGRLLWKKPFGDKIPSVRLPSQLTITLRERHFRHGRDVATYVLDSSSDCIARPVVLSPSNGSLRAAVTILLVITISGNPSRTSVAEGSSNDYLANTTHPEPGPSHPSTSLASDRNSVLQATVESKRATGSESLAPINTRLVPATPQPLGNEASVATDAVTGLTSAASNLEEILLDANLLAEVHPLVKGAWSLVNAVDKMTHAQPDLDKSVEALLDAMNAGSKLAKEHAPVKERYTSKDSVVRDMLREIIKGAHIVKVYCEKRPEDLSAVKTLGSDLAEEVDGCFHALSTMKGKLVTDTGPESPIQIPHMANIIIRSADDEDLKEMLYAEDANRALRDGSRGCLFGTRTDITDAGRDWATGVKPQSERPEYLDAFDSESSVVWLCGVAGAGKSAIVTSLAITLHEMGLLGSTYGFQAAKQATLNPTNFFSTITRHLAQRSPLLKKRLLKIILKTDPVMRATSSPKDQFEKFFLPLLAHNGDQTTIQPTVIIIDAFDECGNIGSRRELLDILTRRAHEIPPSIRILITSRYEPDVQDALASQPKNVCILKMERIPKESTYRDIYAYVHEELKDIQGVDAEQFIPPLTELALAAQESFQWASTACLFIRNEDDGDGVLGPQDRLSQVLRSNEGLDSIYQTVLDRHFSASKLETLKPPLALLGCLAYAREPLSLRTITSLIAPSSASPSLTLSAFQRMARKLSSLVMGAEDFETPLVALHTSFTDFLHDEMRSKKYYVNPVKFHEHLAACSLDVMAALLRFNICDIPTSSKPNAEIANIQERIRKHIPNSLSYACRFWAYHLSQAGAWAESDRLRESVTALLNSRVLEWMEVMSLTETLPLDSLGYLDSTHKIPSVHSHLSNLVYETSQFAAFFAAPIMKSAAHIYLSALPFAPVNSQMFHHLGMRFKRTVQVTAGGLAAWPTTRHILAGHENLVNCVVFSPDGRLIASASDDQTIRLWDTSTGLVVGVLRGHSAAVTSVGFSPNGTLLASGLADGTIRIWDVATRPAVGEPLEGHSGSVQSIAFSPDGTLIASGSHDKTVRVWNVMLRTVVGEPLEGHSGWVLSVAFSRNGMVIASGSGDNTVRLWDVRTRTAVGEPLKGHSDWVRSVAFSPDGKLIVSGSYDGTIRLWDIPTLTVIGEQLKGHYSNVLSVAFSPHGALLASGANDKTIRIWDVSTRTAVGEPLEGHSSSVASVAFSPDSKLVASGSADKTLRIWDVATHTAVGKPWAGRSDCVQLVAFSPDGALIASGSVNNTICIWHVATQTAVGETLKGHSSLVLSVAFSPDGTLIASGSADGTIRVWNVMTHTAVGEPLKDHSDIVRSVAFSPDGTLIVSGSDNQTVRVWDVTTRTAVGEPLMGHSNVVLSVAFSPDGTLIASGSADGTIRVWNVMTHTAVGEPLKDHSDFVQSVVFSPDGKLIASGSYDKTIRIWDATTRAAIGEPLEGHSNPVRSVAFSPDGMLLASASNDQTIRMWDVRTRTAVGEPMESHSDRVNSVAFSPNGMLLVSGSNDKTVRLWDIHSQPSLGHHSSRLSEPAVFAPNGNSSSFHPHQSLINPHPSLCSTRNLQDGWIVGPRGELVLWIPPTLRLGLGESRMLAVLGRPNIHNTLLNFDNMAYGSDWAQCHTVDS